MTGTTAGMIRPLLAQLDILPRPEEKQLAKYASEKEKH